MSLFNPGTMTPIGWTDAEWNKERFSVYMAGNEPSKKGKAAGLARLSFDEPKGGGTGRSWRTKNRGK